jgi:hypothetical protein
MPTSGEHVVVRRPGQVVALDTTILPVFTPETITTDHGSVYRIL